MARFRSLFISDVHLGMFACQADRLLNFLQNNDADTIYLVGDIVDLWALKKNFRWQQIYNEVLQELVAKANNGTQIVYLPGNHDDFFRNVVGKWGNFEIVDTIVHTTAAGERYLVMHGDQFDFISRKVRWLAIIGDVAYDASIIINTFVKRIREVMGLPYWSFSQWAKSSVKHAVTFIEGYRGILAHEAGKQGCRGVICGHIHTAAINNSDEFVYINCGDWVESMTAIVETNEGKFKIITWT